MKSLTQMRQENRENTLRYMKYFVIRYGVALYFFTNLYWMLMIYTMGISVYILLPLILFVLSAVSIWEQVKIYQGHPVRLKGTRLLFKGTIVGNSMVWFLLIMTQSLDLIPFLTFSKLSVAIVSGLLLAGIVLALWLQSSLERIEHNEENRLEIQ